MAHLIDKDALLAEIERRKQDAINNCGGFKSMREHECDSCIVWQYEEMENILDTIEVKEVDLEKEIEKYLTSNKLNAADIQFEPFTQMEKCAKYFYELGVQVSNKAQKGE